MPSERNSRPTDARRSGSSSMTSTVEVGSDIAATRKNRENRPVSWLQAWPDRAFLVPILEPGQPFFSEDARGTPKFTHTDAARRRPTRWPSSPLAQLSTGGHRTSKEIGRAHV